MQYSRDSAYSHSCEEEHLGCSQLVLKHRSKHFRWRLQQRQPHEDEDTDGSLTCASESEAVVDIDQELVQELPLLATISQDIGQEHKEGNGTPTAVFL